jgi:hypothetical protein
MTPDEYRRVTEVTYLGYDQERGPDQQMRLVTRPRAIAAAAGIAALGTMALVRRGSMP